jgi:hypothetical protein
MLRAMSERVHRGWRIVQLVWLASVLLLPVARAFAQAAEPPEYRDVIRRALEEYAAEHYAEAGGLFERAHALFPNARTKWGIGLVAFEDRDYVNAIVQLDASLHDQRKPLGPDQRAEAERIIAKAWQFVAGYRLTLAPATATLLVDDKPAQVVSEQLLLNPGPHELIAAADGYLRETRRVLAKSGERGALEFALVSATQAPVAELPAPTAEQHAAGAQTASVSRRPLWVPYVLLGTGGALLVTSLVTGLMSNHAYSELDSKCGKDQLCPSGYDWRDTRDRGKSLALATDVLALSGLVVAGTGAVLWFLWRHDRTETPQAALACDGHGCFGHMRVSF